MLTRDGFIVEDKDEDGDVEQGLLDQSHRTKLLQIRRELQDDKKMSKLEHVEDHMLLNTKGIVVECSTNSQRETSWEGNQLGNKLRAHSVLKKLGVYKSRQEQERTEQEQLRTRADKKCSLKKKHRSAQERFKSRTDEGNQLRLDLDRPAQTNKEV
ncbi:NAC domain-containing protein 8 [Dorcoceras hygrometricum]|uniref:NAC domain-containing protein 8 n=1 Tax=Dorcoceras hygrometricum TaxID=472368 RepID=A0A2Z7DFW6_9LAMI|nr:NAC domain-containing protein 8 [Dorcoceras hygrometricum]